MDETPGQLLGRLVSPFQRTNPFVQSVSKPHRGQGGHLAKYMLLVDGDEAGLAEPTPKQQDWMMKASRALRRRWSPRSGKILGGDALWSTATATSVHTTPQASRRPLMGRS
jgi:hypothetical protein